VAFYELLGFEGLHDRRHMVWPDHLAGILGLKRAQDRAVLMGLPADRDGPMLDLIEWLEPKAVFTDPAAVAVTVPLKVEPANFSSFSTPGYLKGVVNFRLTALSEGRNRLTTVTRSQYLCEDSRRKIRRYWFFIAPISGAVRLGMLRACKRQAEDKSGGLRRARKMSEAPPQ
jgi:hypothetical protein